MFEWTPPPDRFRVLAWLVAALLLSLSLEIAVLNPYRHWRHKRAHPEIYAWLDTTKCPSGISPSPDGQYVVYNDNPCACSPFGTVVAIYGAREPEGYGTYQTTNAVLNMKSGGPVHLVWRTNRELIVLCRRCREQDAWFLKRQFRDIAIEFRFEGHGEPPLACITGKE